MHVCVTLQKYFCCSLVAACFLKACVPLLLLLCSAKRTVTSTHPLTAVFYGHVMLPTGEVHPQVLVLVLFEAKEVRVVSPYFQPPGFLL